MIPFPKILILEDHRLVAFALTDILKTSFPHAEVAIEQAFFQGVNRMKGGFVADLIILDLHLPGGELFTMIPTLRRIQPDVRILVFTGIMDNELTARLMNDGANGYLSKNRSFTEIVKAVETVMRDEVYLDIEE
jgi:two-component system invasion response regulator UvrY